MSLKSTTFVAALALSSVAGAASAQSLSMQSSLKHQKLPQQTEGDTFLRVSVRGDKVRLGIEAPSEVPVHRQEVLDAMRRHAADTKPPATT